MLGLRLMHDLPANRIGADALELGSWPTYARVLGESWRDDIAAVARRQQSWTCGYRDWRLLERPMFVRVSACRVVLTYGEPALLIQRSTPELLASVRGYERGTLECLKTARSLRATRSLADELKLSTLLHAGLTQLAALNSAADVKMPSPLPNPSRAEGGEAAAGARAADAQGATGGEPREPRQ